MISRESVANASNHCFSQLAAIGQSAKLAVQGIVHASLLTTAAAADFCGTTLLYSGLTSAGVLAVDAYQWSDNDPPIWANAWGKKAVPLVIANPNFQNQDDQLLNDTIKQAISYESLASIALIIGSPLAYYACSKISSTARQIDKDLFQTV